MSNYKCIDCGKKVFRKETKRCRICFGHFNSRENHYKYNGGFPKCAVCKKTLKSYVAKICRTCYEKTLKGRGNPMAGKRPWNYKGIIGSFKCKNCGKGISNYRTRCKTCENIKRFLNGTYNVYPNKAEIKLFKILKPFNFKYVGDGKFWIENRNPDFIHRTKKLIVELFGDYWHKNTQQKDKQRIKLYSKHGYSTLIIWEHELKNANKIKQRLINFL